jgi:hypothetical protein
MDDVQRVESVIHAAYVGYVAINCKTPGPMLDDYAALIAQSRVYVLDDGDVVGVLVLLPEPGVMLLDNVAIDPFSSGNGLRAAVAGVRRRRGPPRWLLT